MSDDRVLVTGASGFIGLHCCLALLQAGYRVRGTLRDLARGASLREALEAHTQVGDRLEFVEADLLSDAGWAGAVRDCRYVLHVASPLPTGPPKHEDDLIIPAREGTLRVLRAAAAAGVERVVLTSSLAAILYGHDRSGSRVFDESDWSIPEKCEPYEKSKTLAERAAWDFVASLPPEQRLELVAINPGLVLGPVLEKDSGTSGEAVRKLMAREFPGCPHFGWATVDVRDVAAAHVAALRVPEAAGQRFVCATDHTWLQEIARILDRRFRDRGYRVPTRSIPDFVVRLFALFDKTTRMVIHELGQHQYVSNQKIKNVLGWKPRSLEEMVVSMGESMIAHGVV